MMVILLHPYAPLEQIGRVYGFDIKFLSTTGLSDADAADAILRLNGDFDCFIVNGRAGSLGSNHPLTISAIASQTIGWVEVLGVEAESIHDAVDLASVRAGREQEVGDGEPMTTWNSTVEEDEIADYVLAGGQGEHALKLVVHFGGQEHEKVFLDLLRKRLANPDQST
jgi:hypothetical protein